MEKKEFRRIIKERVLILDGGMGSMILKYGIPPGQAPEILNIEKPEVVEKIHMAYVEAGADIILTNTFGGSRLRLAEVGLDTRLDEINRNAIRIAKKAAGMKSMTALSIGPSGKFLKPIGALDFDDSYKNFFEQAKIAEDEGCDLIIIETMSDLREIKSALLAAKDAFSGPVIAQMTFTEDGRTVTGTDGLTAYTVLSACGADAIGANCSIGPAALEPVVKTLCEAGDIPISIEPNAGLPVLRDGITVYLEKPETLAYYAERFCNLGVNIIGGCCGTTAEYISLIAKSLKGRKPVERKPFDGLRLASRTRTFTLPESGCTIVGERINPTGRKLLSQNLKEGNVGCLRKEAVSQIEAGAEILDINIGVPGGDEVKLLPEAVLLIESVCDVPIVLDSSNHFAIEAALKVCTGKPVINSVNGEKASTERILPLAKRYGASVIGLCLNEKGIPPTAEERVKIGKEIITEGEAIGISKQEIILDSLTLTVSAQPEGAMETLKTIRFIKNELRVRTILGVSNISFGLPKRIVVSSAFLSEAVHAGLDLAIMNPIEDNMMGAILAGNLLTGSDPNGKRYIERFSPKQKIEDPSDNTPLGKIQKAVIDGDKINIVSLIKTAIDDKIEPFKITHDGLVKGMEVVGDYFGKGIYFLPQVILSAETMQNAFSYIKPLLPKESGAPMGTVVFATVKGDIHDIGKNICITLLENNGFRVINLGKNVPDEAIIDAAIKEKADFVALSALMTTTMAHMGEVIQKLHKAGIKTKVLVGGAVLNREYAKSIEADGYGRDGVECVNLAKTIGRMEL